MRSYGVRHHHAISMNSYGGWYGHAAKAMTSESSVVYIGPRLGQTSCEDLTYANAQNNLPYQHASLPERSHQRMSPNSLVYYTIQYEENSYLGYCIKQF